MKVREKLGNGEVEAEVTLPAFDMVIVDEPVPLQMVHGVAGEEAAARVTLADLRRLDLFDPAVAFGNGQEERAIQRAADGSVADRLRRFADDLGTAMAVGIRAVTFGQLRAAFGSEGEAADDRRVVLAAKVHVVFPGDEALEDFMRRDPDSAARLAHNRLILALAKLLEAVVAAFRARQGAPDDEVTVFLRTGEVDVGRGPSPACW